jgi:mitochondrial chaperone BCS1
MIDGLWDYINNLLQHNQIFSGGLVLMVGGALLAYFRNIPSKVFAFVRRQLITEIDILDRDQAFEWIEKWLSQHSYSRKRARALTIKTESIDYQERRDNPTMDSRPRILFAPAPGMHWFFFRGRLIYLHRERPKLNEATQSVNVRECFNITIFSRNRQLARDLLEEAREVAMPKHDQKLTIHRGSGSYWREQMKRLPRSPESVILADGMLDELIEDVKTFLSRKNWYLDRGIPYRLGCRCCGFCPGHGYWNAELGGFHA